MSPLFQCQCTPSPWTEKWHWVRVHSSFCSGISLNRVVQTIIVLLKVYTDIEIWGKFYPSILFPPRWVHGGDYTSGPIFRGEIRCGENSMLQHRYQCLVGLGTPKTPRCPWHWVPGIRSKFGNWTIVPSENSCNITECDNKPQSTNCIQVFVHGIVTEYHSRIWNKYRSLNHLSGSCKPSLHGPQWRRMGWHKV